MHELVQLLLLLSNHLQVCRSQEFARQPVPQVCDRAMHGLPSSLHYDADISLAANVCPNVAFLPAAVTS